MAEAAVPTITIDGLRALLSDPRLPRWLIHATDTVPFDRAHIPGSLARPDDARLLRLGHELPMVVYGEDEYARAAPALTLELCHLDVEVAWFAAGLTGWAAAGLPVERSG
jgi:rhodanese-related sulfurtransferase